MRDTDLIGSQTNILSTTLLDQPLTRAFSVVTEENGPIRLPKPFVIWRPCIAGP